MIKLALLQHQRKKKKVSSAAASLTVTLCLSPSSSSSPSVAFKDSLQHSLTTKRALIGSESPTENPSSRRLARWTCELEISTIQLRSQGFTFSPFQTQSQITHAPSPATLRRFYRAEQSDINFYSCPFPLPRVYLVLTVKYLRA